MCQEVAVIPLLWVLPLGLYLLSFVLCFESDRGYHRAFWSVALVVAAAASCVVVARGPAAGVPLQVAVLSAALLSGAMACHGELSRLKPGARHLTSFYMAVAAGGAAGGIFVGLVAPRIFRAFWEFPLGLLACGLLLVAALLRDRQSPLHVGPARTAALGTIAVLVGMPFLLIGRARSLGLVAAAGAAVLLVLAWRAVPPATLARFCVAATWLVLGCELLGLAL